MRKNFTDILSAIPHDGVRARLAAFATDFPKYESVDISYDYEDGYACKSESVSMGDTADAIIKWIEHLNTACNTPSGWESTYEEIEKGWLSAYLRECIVGDWGRVMFLTPNDAARRERDKAAK